MKLPNEFELPLPEDFCRDDFTCGKKHCFVGWQRELIPLGSMWSADTKEDGENRERFFKTALSVAKRLKLHARKKSATTDMWTCFDYNDDERNTPKQLAKWFEETIKEFGYDVK
jgi:hypothetical protein